MMARVIGIDVGGTSIKAGVVSGRRISNFTEVKTPRTKDRFVSALLRLIDELLEPGIKAVGIGFPAPIKDGVAYEVQNLPFLDGLNIKAAVEKEFDVKCFVENDANVFCLAEQRFGAAKGMKNVVGITLGTGLGCGIIINRALYSGNTGAAGEISKIPANGHSLEHYVNADFVRMISGRQGKTLFELAKEGNKKAIKCWQDYGKNVGKAISVVVDVLDPEIVVIGGKISHAYPFFRSQIMPQIRKHCFRNAASKVKIAVSELEDSAILGAAALSSARS